MDLINTWEEADTYGPCDCEVERLWTERRLLVVPGCCEASSTQALVALRCPEDVIYGDADENARPHWAVRSSYQEYLDHPLQRTWPSTEVQVCPHCGKGLPAVRRRATPLTPVMSCGDGGSYCDTCKERLSSCKCWPPEAHWEVDEQAERDHQRANTYVPD